MRVYGRMEIIRSVKTSLMWNWQNYTDNLYLKEEEETEEETEKRLKKRLKKRLRRRLRRRKMMN